MLADPIDGSRNAVYGIPIYYVAYIINHVIDAVFWAEKGLTAYCLGRSMQCQKGDEFSFVAYDASTPSLDLPSIIPLLSAANKVRCMEAPALVLHYVACGAVSAFASRSFDFAGGHLLMKESGGRIMDMLGKELESPKMVLRGTTSLLAAGNSGLHKKALALMNR